MKNLLFAILFLIPVLGFGQTTNKNITITKTTPLLILNGTGAAIGIGTTAPLHKVTSISTTTGNLNAFNFVNGSINKNRLTTTQARDTSSFNLWFTYTGSPLLTMTDKNANILFRADSIGFGVGTAMPLTKLSVISSIGTNLNAFNFVNSTTNKNRTTVAQATDSASFNLAFSYTGSPSLNMKSKAGASIIKIDSSSVTPNVPMLMYVGDTTVTAKYGTIVFKTSDSTFYGCKYIRPTGKKKWFKIDN